MKDGNNLEDTKVIDLNSTKDSVEQLEDLDKTKVHQGVTTVTADWKDVAKARNLKHPRKMKKGVKIVLIVLIIILFLSALLFGYYKFFKPESSDVYGTILNASSNKLSEYADKNIAKSNKSYIESGNISIATDMELYKMLDNISLVYSIGVNPSDKIIVSDFSYKEKEKDVLSGNILVKDNKLYLDSKQIYDKPLYLNDVSSSININDITSKEKAKDMKYLIDKTAYYFQKAMLKAKYQTKYGKVSINNKNVLVQKNFMTIDKTNINNIKNDFLYAIKKDNKYIKTLANLYSEEVSVLTKNIDDYLSEDASKDFDTIDFEIDTKLITNKIVAIRIKDDNKLIAKVNNVSNGKYEVNIYENDKPYFEGILIIKSNNINFTTSIDTYKYDISFITNDDSVEALIKVMDEKDKQIKVSVKNNLEYNKKEGKIDTKKAVDVNKLKENEQETISQNLIKQLKDSQMFGTLLEE